MRRMYEISTLNHVSVICIAYVNLYGPFSIVTINLSFTADKTARMDRSSYQTSPFVYLVLAFIVDSFLYAWGYKMCRLHMMKSICFFRKSKLDEITNTLNDRYCTYRIDKKTKIITLFFVRTGWPNRNKTVFIPTAL